MVMNMVMSAKGVRKRTKKSRASSAVPAGEFKSKCLELMDRVAETGAPIVITKRGKPVAQLAPMVDKPETLQGFAKGRIRILGNIIAPLDLDWHAAR